MSPIRARLYAVVLTLSLVLSACSPDASVLPTSTQPPPDPETISLELINSSFLWPERSPDEPCSPGLPAPTIKICLKNGGQASASPEGVGVALPAFLAWDAIQEVLSSLPGGTWLPPYPISILGLPGVDASAEGMFIVNTNPAPDAAAEGIIIVNTIPANSDISSAFIVIQNMPDPLTAEGLLIIQSEENTQALIGATTVKFNILALHPESSSPVLGVEELATDITQDHFQVTGEITGVLEFSPLENLADMENGVIWGGIVPDPPAELASSSALVTILEFGPPPDDNMPPPDDNSPPPDDSLPPPDDNKIAIVWGGMPADAAGIIIANSLPSSSQVAEGILLVNAKDISQVMGIIMEDKPAAGEGAEGIVIVDTKPAEFLPAGIAWDAVVWSGMPDSNRGTEGIIIVENKPALGSSNLWTGFPIGFGLPEGMTPMMGQGGYGPLAFGSLANLDKSFYLAPEEEKCFEINLTPFTPLLTGGGGTFPVDSFFDVFTELTVGMPGAGEGSRLVSRIEAPAVNLCTPTPGPISTLIPELAIPTPTPTLRTGLPTATPGDRRLPTPTPTSQTQRD